MLASTEFLPIKIKFNILLADDDKADCLLFSDALAELPVSAKLTIVENGEALMDLLDTKAKKYPDVIFLDLNMPKKNGFTALGEIKRNSNFEKIPVIILTTADDPGKITQVYRDAAHYYIIKPKSFPDLKRLIYKSLQIISAAGFSLPVKKNFLIQ